MSDRQPDQPDDEDAGGAEPVTRHRVRGAFLGAAMMGIQQAMFGRPDEDTVIEITASGDPPNIDLDGLDEDFGRHGRLVGPPLDRIKARHRPSRRARRR